MKRMVPNEGSRYLTDESGLVGNAESVYIPETLDELGDILELTYAGGAPATIRGGGTGINGAAVPEGGRVISMEALDHALELNIIDSGECAAELVVEAGMTLKKLKDGLKNGDLMIGDRPLRDIVPPGSLYFRPDPTETSATVGGLLMTNAMGPNGIPFVRDVRSVRMSSPVFDETDFVRGKSVFGEGGLSCSPLPAFEVDTVFGDRAKRVPLSPHIGDDILELFAGSEGMLAVCFSMCLRLYRTPALRLSVALLNRDDRQSFGIMNDIIQIKTEGASLDSVDMLNGDAVGCAESLRSSVTDIAALPVVSENVRSMFIAGFSADDRESMDEILDRVLTIAEEYGIEESDTWAFEDETGIERLRAFRHGASEGINLCQSGLLSGDRLKMVGDASGGLEMLDRVRMQAEEDAKEHGFPLAVIMHGVVPRLHMAPLPADAESYERALGCFRAWHSKMQKDGLGLHSENGCGKLKYRLIGNLFNDIELAKMARVKTAFDPAITLNRGDLTVPD